MGLPEEPFLICLFLKHTVLLTGYPVCQLLYKVIHIDPYCRRYAIRQLLETAVFVEYSSWPFGCQSHTLCNGEDFIMVLFKFIFLITAQLMKTNDLNQRFQLL
jgi:hypothetical protein